MTSRSAAPLDVALRELIAALEGSGLTYALGGAMAFAIWAVPRATSDIDITVWCSERELDTTIATVYGLGAGGPALAQAQKQARANGVAYLDWRGIRLDLFVPSIPFYDDALATRRRIDVPGVGSLWALSMETLAVFKMLFFRPKDLVDVKKLLEIQDDSLDRGWVRERLVSMLGVDDERVRGWDALA